VIVELRSDVDDVVVLLSSTVSDLDFGPNGHPDNDDDAVRLGVLES